MLEAKQMQRLNELARKKKTGQLTDEEVQEQAQLRKLYLQMFRTGMKQTLENTKVIDPEGNDVTPDKIKAKRVEKLDNRVEKKS